MLAYLILAGILGVGFGFLISHLIVIARITKVKERANEIIRQAETKAKEIIKNAELSIKERWINLKSKLEKELAGERKELERFAKSLSEREARLEKRSQYLTERESALIRNEKHLTNLEKILKTKIERYDQLIEEEIEKLEKLSALSREDAKKELFNRIKQQAEQEAYEMVKEIKERAKKEAEERAKEIISQAIQRIGLGHWSETTVSVISLPSDELKGRIIGREGRNIRTFETLTGVEVLVDDTPGAVILSAFDPLRREKAKIAMEKLISDGRIHPARIEEVIKEVEREMEKIIRQTGENTARNIGIIDLNPAFYTYIGKMKFRTSYGQNLLQHSIEVARLASLMAEELNLDTQIAKRAGLLHDIGKVADSGYEGPHALIGAKIAEQLGETPVVVNAIAAHHEETVPKTPYAFIVSAADAISGARPGARRETLESYLKRLEKLEDIAMSYKGVEKAYAIQAGRELRVLVQPEEISDMEAEQLAKEISAHIQKELKYPGYIKVVVIRETRKVEYAR